MAKQSKKDLVLEFGRYLIVGGGAFAVDFGTLTLCQEFLIPDLNGWGLSISTTLAFIAGLIFNYVFSLIFVFQQVSQKGEGKSVWEFTLFTIIGVIGLLLTNGGMYFGVVCCHLHYTITKIFVTCAVLFWNYGARKVLIFK